MSSDILTQLCKASARRAEEEKTIVCYSECRRRAERCTREHFLFENTLAKKGLSVIAEVKRASPSKGMICPDFHPVQIAEDYENAGADCLSVLTEPRWFLGSDRIFCDIRAKSSLPMLRKDFTVDLYQVYQARAMGADAVLLIIAALGEKTEEYIKVCREIGLSALVETHDEREIELALKCGAYMIGVNNRNLKDFTVDDSRAIQLRRYIPADKLFIAESGILSPSDAVAARNAGADAVLVGEALMRSQERAAFIGEAKNEHKT